jgi:hypothetical protein
MHFSFANKYIASPPPEGHFLLANFSQKFDQKLASDPKGISYSIFL